jgi:hypothetical protein
MVYRRLKSPVDVHLPATSSDRSHLAFAVSEIVSIDGHMENHRFEAVKPKECVNPISISLIGRDRLGNHLRNSVAVDVLYRDFAADWLWQLTHLLQNWSYKNGMPNEISPSLVEADRSDVCDLFVHEVHLLQRTLDGQGL